jgi:hypothetical protein
VQSVSQIRNPSLTEFRFREWAFINSSFCTHFDSAGGHRLQQFAHFFLLTSQV